MSSPTALKARMSEKPLNLIGKGAEEKKNVFLWSFANPGDGGVSEGSEKAILLF